MRKCGWKTVLVLFLLFLLSLFNPTAEAGTGSIRAKIVLPGDTGVTIPLSVGIHSMSIRPFDGGDGGGGDGGGGGSGGDGGGGGDGGYWGTPWVTTPEQPTPPVVLWNPIPPVTIGEDRILALENLTAGLKNLLIKYEKDMKDQFGNVIKDQFGNVKKEEFEVALKNIRVLEGQVTVETEDGKKVKFGKGDFVTFPKGLSCTWIVEKPVRKHYNFK